MKEHPRSPGLNCWQNGRTQRGERSVAMAGNSSSANVDGDGSGRGFGSGAAKGYIRFRLTRIRDGLERTRSETGRRPECIRIYIYILYGCRQHSDGDRGGEVLGSDGIVGKTRGMRGERPSLDQKEPSKNKKKE